MASSVQVRSLPELESSLALSEARASGVSWPAVFAGAFVAMALSLILMALGTGVGLSAGALWANGGAPATAVGVGAIIWLIAIEVIASSTGGYIAGRLRTKWASIHSHEVYFRDTAHGFLVWAVAVVATGAFLGAAAASMAGAAATNPSMGAVRGTADTRELNANQYFADTLFRTTNPAAAANDTALRDEANLILINGLKKGALPTQDAIYLSQLLSARTGLPPQQAEQRAQQVFADDLTAATAARKAVAHSLYWLFVALLIGAYCASHAATIGGRQRDQVQRATA
ncbi:MAG TPA: hypothetical protein VIY69_06660 [Candidatus Acidoferrales bacterium]